MSDKIHTLECAGFSKCQVSPDGEVLEIQNEDETLRFHMNDEIAANLLEMLMDRAKLSFINAAESSDCGNGTLSDIIHLKNNTIIVIGTEGIGWYKSEEEFNAGTVDGHINSILCPEDINMEVSV